MGVARSLKNLTKIQDLQLKEASALDAGGWEAVGVFLSSFKNILLIFIWYVCMNILPAMYVRAPHACSALRGQRRASEPLERELQVIVSSHVGAEN